MGIFLKNSYEDVDRYGICSSAEVTIRSYLQTYEQFRRAATSYGVI